MKEPHEWHELARMGSEAKSPRKRRKTRKADPDFEQKLTKETKLGIPFPFVITTWPLDARYQYAAQDALASNGQSKESINV
jgi:hypothetical protein